MPFRIWSPSALRYVILWSIKAIKINLKFIFPVCRINFRIQHLICPFIDHCVTIHYNIFWSPSHASFLTVSSINFWSYLFWLMNCRFRSSSRHVMQAMGVSESKIIFLYPLMVWLQKSFDPPSFYTSKKIHHHHHSVCWIVGFLYKCIYTLQHIPEDDNFCLVCMQN